MSIVQKNHPFFLAGEEPQWAWFMLTLKLYTIPKLQSRYKTRRFYYLILGCPDILYPSKAVKKHSLTKLWKPQSRLTFYDYNVHLHLMFQHGWVKFRVIIKADWNFQYCDYPMFCQILIFDKWAWHFRDKNVWENIHSIFSWYRDDWK